MQNSIHIKSLKATLKENTNELKKIHFQLFIILLILCIVLAAILFTQSLSFLKIIGSVATIIYLVVKQKSIIHLQTINKKNQPENQNLTIAQSL